MVAKGNLFYFQGDHKKALESYERAVALSSTSLPAWLNGSVVWEETGQPLKAIAWLRRAAELPAAAPLAGAESWEISAVAGADVLGALGWAEFRAGDAARAKEHFQQALQRPGDHAWALFGLARLELSSKRPVDALKLLNQAAQAAPLLNLIPYYRGKAYELLNEPAKEAESYRQTVIGDSYFMEGRDALGRVELRARNFNEAWRHFSKILDVEPRHKRLLTLVDKIRPFLTRKTWEIRSSATEAKPFTLESDSGHGQVPVLRVGIGSNSMGRPLARGLLRFRVNVPFWLVDAKTGAKWLQGRRDQTWEARVKRVKKTLYIDIGPAASKTRLLKSASMILRPDSPSKGLITLDEIPYAHGSNWTGVSNKTLRGDLELSLYRAQKSIKLVNVVDLENYTNGVVAAEMPIQSPLEALKAQAVVARSHALFIKLVTRRHRREGYDVCDEQHCQVYAGVRAESERSRDVVEATRGRIATFRGKVAHVIYSSNCGGHTQSGRDLAGWGDVPYWSGARDADGARAPISPWELRRWLYETPAAYCKPSAYVYPAHFRWTRVIGFAELEEKINRKYAIGKLLRVQAGRRSLSGNVNSLAIMGSKRKVQITSELNIRGLLGLGSLRSTMFVIDAEYGPDLKPRNYVLYGGGWGHGVGLCQSGAMGRADAGQTYEEIIKAYFKGAELGQLAYERASASAK